MHAHKRAHAPTHTHALNSRTCVRAPRLEFKAVLEADESAQTKKDVHAALTLLKKLQACLCLCACPPMRVRACMRVCG
jgi:hypothetical protein